MNKINKSEYNNTKKHRFIEVFVLVVQKLDFFMQ